MVIGHWPVASWSLLDWSWIVAFRNWPVRVSWISLEAGKGDVEPDPNGKGRPG
jgi:hypothetical protein